MLTMSALAFQSVAQAPPPSGRKAEWLQLRGDAAMTGRSSGIGHMVDGPPAEGWRYDIAAWESYFSVDAHQAANGISLPFQAPVEPGYIREHQRDWGIGIQEFDLGGEGGALVGMPVSNLSKVARILTDVAGLQRFEMEDSFTDGGAAPKRGRLIAYDTGEPRIVWETELFDNIWSPNVIVVDADADGQLDLAVATHYRIIVFDGATGATKMLLRYHDFRNYGWFGALDIDGDPYPEFGVVADFSMHAEIIDNDGSELSLRWIREIQPDPSQSTKIVRPPPGSLVDVDGDGAVELVYSIYNDTDDGEWHIIAVDAVEGNTRYDFPRLFLNGIRDLDGDGRPELFVTATDGETLPPYAPLKVWTLDDAVDEPIELWTHPRGRFSTRRLDSLPLNASSGAADGLRAVVTGDADGDGRLEFFVAAPSGDGEVLSAYAIDDLGEIGALWSVAGPGGAKLRAVAVGDEDGRRRALVYLRGRGVPGQDLVLTDAAGSLRQWNRQPFTPAGTPVVADLEADGRIEVVVQTALEEVVCIEAPLSTESSVLPRARWQMQGHGQTNNAPFHWGVIAADLDGDGTKEVLFARETARGNASLAAVEPDGRIRWETVFAEFDGSMPIWNFSGLSYWSAGHFTSTQHQDVFVTLRKGKIGSEIGHLVDGRDGSIVWAVNGFSLPADGSGRSLGGHPSASGDLDGDGLDEIVVMWPDRLHIVDGPSGRADVVRQAYGYTTGLNPMFSSNTFVGYAFPAIVDLFGDSTPELIWGHSGYLNAVLTAAGDRVWETPYLNNAQVQSLMGVGDIDGDGSLELLASMATGVQVFNPADGEVLHTLSGMARATTDIVSGDVDGDGRDEFLYASSNRIFCLEEDEGTLVEAWSLDVGAHSSDLALADVDADGFLDLIVVTTDGYVKAYTGASPATGTSVAATSGSTPLRTALEDPYPNPFNSSVVISYRLEEDSRVELEVFDLMGQRVALLVDARQPPGRHSVVWGAVDSRGRAVSSGVYVTRLRAGSRVIERKIALVK